MIFNINTQKSPKINLVPHLLYLKKTGKKLPNKGNFFPVF